MAGTIKVDSINADSNLALKIANTAVAFIDSNGLRPTSGNVSLDATATSKVYLPSANTVAIQTAGVTAVTVDSSQNATFAGTLTTTGITNSGVATGARFNPTGSSVTGNGMYLPAANSLGLSTNGTNAVYIDSSQNVGIGVASSLTGKLSVGTVSYGQQPSVAQVNGTSLAIANNAGIFNIGSTDSSAADVGGSLGFTANGGVSGYATGQISGRRESATSSVYSSYMAFSTTASNSVIAERMRINSSGNVGIGVTTLASWSLGKALEIGFSGNSLNATRQAEFNLNCNAIYEGSWKYGGTGKAAIIQFTDGSISTFTTTASGTAGAAASLTTGPYVANGGTSWTSASDERLKNITGEIENALDKVGQLRAAKFTWKADTENKPQVGLIAQDVQAVLPEVVNSTAYIMDDETEYLGVNYDQVIPLLLASIKELKAINDTQAETITALTARIVALETI
jgi:hypothetical protein